MTTFLGIKFSHVPILSIIIFIFIIIMQIVNKFVYTDKGFTNISVQARLNYKETGYLVPFFQAGAIDMYKGNVYDTPRIVNIITYYVILLSGLMLTESVLGRYSMLLLLLIGVGIEFISFSMLTLTCFPYGSIVNPALGDLFCCGTSIQWYYAGVIASILFNYHFLAKKKITTSVFILLYIILGVIISMYQKYYVYGSQPFMKSIDWCATGTMSVAPYLIGGAFTAGSLGLLFTKF